MRQPLPVLVRMQPGEPLVPIEARLKQWLLGDNPVARAGVVVLLVGIALAGGYDQNVSRPMLWCQLMSHSTPTMTLVDANSTASTCHGTDAADALASSRAGARAGA